MTDADAALVKAPEGIPGNIHQGFAKAIQGLSDGITQALQGLADGHALWVTGHSLGGALATLASVRLSDRPSFGGVYTFASPRVGDADFAGGYGPPHFRVINNSDIVPQIPPKYLGYQHVGTRVHLVPGGEPQVTEPGNDPDDSLLPSAVAGQIDEFVRTGLLTPPFLAGLLGGGGGFDPLGPLSALDREAIRLGLIGDASRLSSWLGQLLETSLDCVERLADQVCQQFPSGVCDHFPLSYIRALGGSEVAEG